MGDLFEPVDMVPGLLSPHMEYAKLLIPAFLESGYKFVRVTNMPKFEVSTATLIDTIRQFAIPRGVQVVKRGADIYLVNKRLAEVK